MKPVYRILDANVNRAREGLRVVEEICRFVIEDKKLTLSIKKLRSELVKIIRASEHQIENNQRIRISEKMLRARRSLSDVGAKLYTKSESKRSSVIDIFRSNMKRVEEAVRVLEEFSKMIDPKLGRKFKKVRMKAYQVEKRIVQLFR